MEFEKKEIVYFKEPGKANTEKTIELALAYSQNNNINTIVIASSTGNTALKLKEKVPDLNIICVTYSDAVKYKDKLEEFQKNKSLLEEKGITIVKSIHALSGIEKSLTAKYCSMMPATLIADILRLFSEGVKVCVESSMMAVDTGAVKEKEKTLVMGGSHEGCDTCLLVEPSCTSKFFEFGILEIICIPKHSGLLH